MNILYWLRKKSKKREIPDSSQSYDDGNRLATGLIRLQYFVEAYNRFISTAKASQSIRVVRIDFASVCFGIAVLRLPLFNLFNAMINQDFNSFPVVSDSKLSAKVLSN